MASPMKSSSSRISLAMERTGQWVFSQDIPADVTVQVGGVTFSLHKFMLAAKSDFIRKLILEYKETDLTRIDLSDIPGGPDIFEKAAKFCYAVNFEITIHNVAALRCAAEYLQMTDKLSESNLVGRTEDFFARVALSSLSGAVVVLRTCQDLLPMAENLLIVHRCVELVSAKACLEANFPSQSPPNWWTEELTVLDVEFFSRIIDAIKARGAKPLTIARAIITYAERSLRDLVRDHSGNGIQSTPPETDHSDVRIQKRELLESIVTLFPPEKTAFPINFLCCLLRAAILLGAGGGCRSELEKRISAFLELATVDDLLAFSMANEGGRLFDLESVRRVISGFVEKEKNVAVFNGGEDFRPEVCSAAVHRVAKTVDGYLAEIASHGELSISKFNGIANLVPKGARKVDDDLYRAIDVYLKAHPQLDEIEREKVCSVMDPLKLSYEARVHASQNKRLPVQIVLHALYYDQLKLRSGGVAADSDRMTPRAPAICTRNQLQADVSLMKENEALRTELLKMKMVISEMQKGNSTGNSKGSSSSSKKPTFFSTVSKKLGKLNPFKPGSKDTSHLDDDDSGLEVAKPRRRRFSLS
ncbi:unnamed protein product [Cuscuta epithymum]|uniref:Root phototropism protein 2 n=1 Tax=Cuscuta epithymum TaxID=186058 RepID=A0AAV0F1D2_9ASTE|nr:unnamed protein product [Cuscuta epithymum]CAH9129327.1 unnamed protein product [Cuscuta epithymum]